MFGIQNATQHYTSNLYDCYAAIIGLDIFSVSIFCVYVVILKVYW